jgi:predicted dehydrogenase
MTTQPHGSIPLFETPVPFPQECALGIGIIGAGSVANQAHLPQYRTAGYRVVGCADRRAEAADGTAARWGLAFATTDYRRLLDRSDVQVVLITIHPEQRLQVVRDAAAAGKHILIEKPLAHSYTDAVAMVRAAETAGIKLAVNQNRRWMPVHRAARLLLDQHAIGRPYLAVYTGRSNQDYLVGSWYERYRHFLLIEYCVHHLDLLVYWLGEPDSVYATTSRSPVQRFAHDMVSLVTLHYRDGERALLAMNDVARYEVGDGFFIEGTAGILRKEGEQHLTVASDQTGGAVVRKQLQPVDSFAASMGDLLLAIQENREPLCSGRRALATMRTVFAACRAADEGRVVALAEIAQEARE